MALKLATPEDIYKELAKDESRRDKRIGERTEGQRFFSGIYGKFTHRILSNMASTHPLLGEFAIDHLYTGLFSDFSVLNPLETGVMEMVCCLIGEVESQAKGHVFGVKALGLNNEGILRIAQYTAAIIKDLDAHAPSKRMPSWEWWTKFGVKGKL